MKPCLIVCILIITTAGQVRSEEIPEEVRPTPLTRPELKRFMEGVKNRTPRIPLPEMTPEELANLEDRARGYEARVRQTYLNGIDSGRTFGTGGSSTNSSNSGGNSPGRSPQNQDPNFSLSDELKVELFWIVSRVNNCQYCIGHQESKLLRLGLSDDQIGALDYDWTLFDPASQIAFAFGRKYTLEPHELCDLDIEQLRPYFNDDQILEMILSMAGNNAINRWKEAIGVPQHADGGGYSSVGRFGEGQTIDPSLPRGSYMTPTSAQIAMVESRIVERSENNLGELTCSTVSRRPVLESRELVERKLLECRSRVPRIPLMDEQMTLARIPSAKPDATMYHLARLLARFPIAGPTRYAGIQEAWEKGDLDPVLKAQIAWIVARQDRAWYVLELAKKRLIAAGWTLDQIFSLDGDWEDFSPSERALFNVAQKLGNAPVVLDGHDVKRAVELAGPRDVVQTVSFVTNMASFNRISEATGLPTEN